MMKRVLFPIFLFTLHINLEAQLIVDTSLPPYEYVQNVLMGSEVTISNLTINGIEDNNIEYTNSIGAFYCPSCAISIDQGLIVTNGLAIGAEGPNYSPTKNSSMLFPVDEDADLSNICSLLKIGMPSEITVIEFDFVPFSEHLDLQFVWGSDEYDSYVDDNDTDVCGIFLSGPDINGPFSNNAINLAVIPGTDIPISVATINNGNHNEGPCMNCELYHSYESDFYQIQNPTDIHFDDPYFSQYDGWTDPINNSLVLVCGSTYHMKIAVADGSYPGIDSGLFIRGRVNSQNDLVQIRTEFANGQDSELKLYEACGNGSIIFQKPNNFDINTELSFNLEYTGNAAFGIDYSMLPNSITIPAGEIDSEIAVEVFSDGLMELTEQLTIIVTQMNPCNNTLFQHENTIDVYQSPVNLTVLDHDVSKCLGSDIVLIPTIIDGSGWYSYTWEDGSTEDSLLYQAMLDSLIDVTVTDQCSGYSANGTFDITVSTPTSITTSFYDVNDALPFDCNEEIILLYSSQGDVPPYVYTVERPTGTFSPAGASNHYVASGTEDQIHYFHVMNNCGNSHTEALEIDIDLDALEVNIPDTLQYHCGEQNNINAVVTYNGNNSNTLNYTWQLGDNEPMNGGTSHIFYATGETQLIMEATGFCAEAASDTMILVMLPYDPNNINPNYLTICEALSGCLDSTACNFSNLAIFDDESCIYEIPNYTISGPTEAGNSNTFGYAYDSPGIGFINWIITNGELSSGQGSNEVGIQWYEAGLGTISVQETFGTCSSDVITFSVNVNGVGEINSNPIRLFPNPCKDYLQVELPQDWLNNHYDIIDASGRVVKSGMLTTHAETLQLTNVSAGQYDMKIISEKGEIAHRQVIILQ